MHWIQRIGRRLRLVVNRGAVEQAMSDEIRYHLDCETAERVRQGMAPDAARRAALLDFGGVEQVKEASRDVRGGRLAEDLVMDLRYAARVLRRNPAFTAAAVLTFALGVGAAIAIFSVVRGVLLRPLPYGHPDALATLWERNVAKGADFNVVSPGTFEAWRERTRSFSGMVALVPAPSTVLIHGEPERITGVQVTGGYFSLLGIAPLLGRDLRRDDEAGGGAPVTVLSHAFWERHYGADSTVVGRSLSIDGTPVTIVGVMPAGFDPPRYGWIDEQQLWLPFGVTAANRAWGRFLHVVARLRPGVAVATAGAELADLGRILETEMPGNQGWTANADGLAQQIIGDVRSPLLLLMAGVTLLLTMAIVNVANLTLGLARRREHELAIRRAIGASARRLQRQLFAQSALLGLLGGGAGVLVAAAGVRLLRLVVPPSLPRAESIRVDGAVLLVAILVAGLATLIFGSVAAWRGTAGRGPEVASLSASSAGRATARSDGGTLVALEMALALVLTMLAGLMVRSFANLRALDLGFTADQVVAGRIGLTGERYAAVPAQRAFFDAVIDRLRRAPGVQSAGLVTTRPFRGGAPATDVFDPAHPFPAGVEPPTADIRMVDSSFFHALTIPLLVGRGLMGHEPAEGAPRVVINQALARALGFPADPIGRQVAIRLNGGFAAEIVGVVGNVHLVGQRTVPRATAYLAAARFPSPVMDIVLRGADPALLARTLRREVGAVDPSVPVYEVEPIQDRVDGTVARDRFTTLLLGAFSLVALLLAGVGIYGVFSADVASRRREIGIRRALGAGSGSVVSMVARRALVRAGVGILLGLGLALVATRGMASLLFGIGTLDPVAFVSVTAILFGVAGLATMVPAWRAARVSPLSALRGE